MHRVTLAVKDEMVKEAYKVNMNMIEKQEKTLEDLENLSDDHYNFRDICLEQNIRNKVHVEKKLKFIRI